jgi:hypothetical protein
VDEEGAADLPVETLAASAQVAFATSTDAARAVLQAVQVRSDAAVLTAIACNGMQVAKAVATASGWPEQTGLVPAAELGPAARIFGAAGNVRVAAAAGPRSSRTAPSSCACGCWRGAIPRSRTCCLRDTRPPWSSIGAC